MHNKQINSAQPLTELRQLAIRKFQETDRQALRELFVVSRDAAFIWSSNSEHKLEDFDIVTAGELIFVAEIAGKRIGFASIDEADSFLHNLFVHPQYQGRGVGKALLACCGRYFLVAPTLKCVKANVSARRFYEAHGWTVRSEAEGPDGPYLLMVCKSY